MPDGSIRFKAAIWGGEAQRGSSACLQEIAQNYVDNVVRRSIGIEML